MDDHFLLRVQEKLVVAVTISMDLIVRSHLVVLVVLVKQLVVYIYFVFAIVVFANLLRVWKLELQLTESWRFCFYYYFLLFEDFTLFIHLRSILTFSFSNLAKVISRSGSLDLRIPANLFMWSTFPFQRQKIFVVRWFGFIWYPTWPYSIQKLKITVYFSRHFVFLIWIGLRSSGYSNQTKLS